MHVGRRTWRLSGRGLRPLAACSALLLGVQAHAQQWYFEPSITLQTLYDDNVGLAITGEKASAALITTAAASTGRRSQVLDMGLDAKLTRRDYFNDPDRNTTDLMLKGSTTRKTRVDSMQLNIQLDLDSTTTSELSTSGLTAARKRRVRWQVAPSWRHQLNQRWGVTANASYQDVSYRDAALTGLVDYTYATLGVDTDYGLDQRTQLLGQVSFSRYKTDQTSVTSDTTGVLGGVAYNFSPTLSVRGLIGLRRSDTSQTTIFGTANSSSTGYLADILASKQFQTGALTVGLNKSLNPSGNGQLLDSQRISVDWNRRLGPRWRWGVTATRYQNEQAAGSTGTSSRSYLTITPTLRYRLDREWSLAASYRYRYEKYDINTDSATSNAVSMTLSYRPLSKK